MRKLLIILLFVFSFVVTMAESPIVPVTPVAAPVPVVPAVTPAPATPSTPPVAPVPSAPAGTPAPAPKPPVPEPPSSGTGGGDDPVAKLREEVEALKTAAAQRAISERVNIAVQRGLVDSNNDKSLADIKLLAQDEHTFNAFLRTSRPIPPDHIDRKVFNQSPPNANTDPLTAAILRHQGSSK